MSLNRKILAVIIAILSIFLLINTSLITNKFRQHYTEALLSGSFALGYSIESVINEMLDLGLPLDSIAGMNKRLSELKLRNAHIRYIGIADHEGHTLFHSNLELVGRHFDDKAARNVRSKTEPFWQLYDRFDGQQYYDIAVPLINPEQQRLGAIRVGFATSIVEDKVQEAINQTLIIALVTFVGIGLLLKLFLTRSIVTRIRHLSDFAGAITRGEFQPVHRVAGEDEIGELASSLQVMGETIHRQIKALQQAGAELENRVEARTHELADANQTLETRNLDLQGALERERELGQMLKESEERFRKLFEQNKAVMLIVDPDKNQIIDANFAAASYYGFPREQLQQLPMSAINTLSEQEIQHELELSRLEGRDQLFFRHTLASGKVRDVEVHAGPVEWGGRTLTYAIVHDITSRKRAESKLEHLAHYDVLTGLPNRLLKTDRLRQAIAVSRRKGTQLAVCYLDLDGFKPVNDHHGHDVGDQLLMEIAQRLQATVREGDTVSRIGGDEFVLLLTELAGIDECQAILQRVLSNVSQPILVDGVTLEVSASIGLTLFPDDDNDPDLLLRHADQAMYVAKNLGKNRYHQFNPDEDRQVRAHLEEYQRLHQAFEQNELIFYYQPKVNMFSGEVIGIEALIRWNHPQRGILPPGLFLHLIDGTELEFAIGRWVIDTALSQLEQWHDEPQPLGISVNISVAHLQHPGFVEQLQQSLTRHPKANPVLLELEILETASIDDASQILSTLLSCRELGIHFALDDFGTGYSSLATFHQLPVDVLKIDQSFVRDMLEDPQDLAIVDSVVRLADAFQNPVIAEGVETLEHALSLLRLGCHMGQGYGIGRPMPVEELKPWLEQWHNNAQWQNLHQSIDLEQNMDWKVATASHHKWLEAITEGLRHGHSHAQPPMSSRHCTFGRWFHGTAFHRYGYLPMYGRINRIHEQIHRLAQELVDLSQTHPEGISSRIDELHKLSHHFTDEIGRLVEQSQSPTPVPTPSTTPLVEE